MGFLYSLLLAICFLLAGFAAQSATISSLKYSIKFDKSEINKSDSSLNIKLEVKCKKDIFIKIMYPGGAFMGRDKLCESIPDYKVDTGTLVEQKDGEYILIKPLDGQLALSYRLNQTWKGELGVKGSLPYLPIIQNTYFLLPGKYSLMIPEELDDNRVHVEFAWNVPEGWRVFNSLGFDNFMQSKSIDMKTLQQSKFFAGNSFNQYIHNTENGLILVNLMGKWAFNEKDFAEEAADIVNNEQKVMEDKSNKYFIITVIPIQSDNNSFSGESGKNAFTLFLSKSSNLNKKIFWLISHEAFHYYNVPDFFKIEKSEEEAELYWFTEGFTEYMAHLIDFETKIWNFRDLVANYNRSLLLYYYSPYTDIKNSDMVSVYWKTPGNVFHWIPYFRGEIIAHNWNVKIKNESGNKSDFSDMFKAFMNSYRTTGKLLTYEKINKISKRYLKGGIEPDVKKYVMDGIKLEPNPNTFGEKCRLVIKKVAPFEIGFNLPATEKAGTITGLKKDSFAYKAGLRNGETFLSCDADMQYIKSMFLYNYDYIGKMVNVKIKGKNGNIKTISYLPYKGELKPVPQFEIIK